MSYGLRYYYRSSAPKKSFWFFSFLTRAEFVEQTRALRTQSKEKNIAARKISDGHPRASPYKKETFEKQNKKNKFKEY